MKFESVKVIGQISPLEMGILGEDAVALPPLQSFQAKMTKIGWIVFFTSFLASVGRRFGCIFYVLKSFDNILFHYTPHLSMV